MLKSRREVTIGRDEIELLAVQLSKAKAAKDSQALRNLQARLVEKRCSGSIKYLEARKINKASLAFSTIEMPADKLSATVNWYPEKDYLRVRADVIDANFSTTAPDDHPTQSSSFDLHANISGLNADIYQCIVVPDGPGGKAKVHGFVNNGTKRVDTTGITAYWKRTEKGYVVDIRVPWEKLPGYDRNYTGVLVEAAVNSKTPDGIARMTMQGVDAPWLICRGYAALKRK